jgi:hypothetical protein
MDAGLARNMAMGQQLQAWRSREVEKLWLSMLIDAMEQASRPELRALPCDRSVLAKVSAQLNRKVGSQLNRPKPPCMRRTG